MRRKRPHEMMRQMMDASERYGWGSSDRLWLCGHEHWPSRSIGFARVYRAMRLFEMWAHIEGVESQSRAMIDDIKSEMWDRFQNHPVERLKISGIATLVDEDGPHVGRNIVEVRTSGCNLECSGCDHARVDNGVMMSSEMIRRAIHSIWAGEEVLTVRGGEPLLWQENMAFLEMLFDWKFEGRVVHLETNGSIIPNFLVRSLTDSFVVKPRVTEVTTLWKSLFKIWERLKPVYKLSASEENEVRWMMENALPGVKGERLCIVPRGATREEVTQSMVNLQAMVDDKKMIFTPNRRIMAVIQGEFK